MKMTVLNGYLIILLQTLSLTLQLGHADIHRGGILFPRESETRQVVPLDGIWNFVVPNISNPFVGFEQHWYKKDLREAVKSNVLLMPVPSSYNDITTDWRIRDHVGLVWYDRTFFVPKYWAEIGRIWLRFGSVSYASQVWINGQLVMSHEIGHLPFHSEVTQYLKFGKENRVTVACDNTLLADTIPQGRVEELERLEASTGFHDEFFWFPDPASMSHLMPTFRQLLQVASSGQVLLTIAPVSAQKSPRKPALRMPPAMVGETSASSATSTRDPSGNQEKFLVILFKIGRLVQTYTFDFFNYAGIDRPVKLYTTPKTYIDDISVLTVEVQSSSAILEYNVTVMGDVNVTCRVSLIDKHKNVVANSGDYEDLYGLLKIDNPNLWWPYLMHPEPGYQYTFQVELRDEFGDLVDKYSLPIGLRTIAWTQTSLLINNRPVYLHGFGRHEDADIRGKGLDLPLIIRDHNLIKWVGANVYRTSHYPYAEEIMDVADEMGIMIIDECPSVNTEFFIDSLLAKHKVSLSELIKRDKNRPGVIMWSAANEPRTQYTQAKEYFRKVIEHIKSLDLSRPTTIVEAQNYNAVESSRYVDIISFNRYNGWYSNEGNLDIVTDYVIREATAWHQKFNKPVIMQEYGGDTLEGLHFTPNFIWSEEYQVNLLSRHFEAFDRLRASGFFIGEFIWNFADFKTAQTYTRVGGNKKGIFTRSRQPKASAHHLRRRYWALAKEYYNATLPVDLTSYIISGPQADRDEL